jgi:hypothetical protein
MTMKYPTLKSLHEAYKAGEITADPADGDGTLTLDNDTAYVYVSEEKVFEMHPEVMLGAALDLLGIPNDHV